MNIAIVCCTPYHIINAINLKLNKFIQDEVDIYISNHFSNSYEIFCKLKEINIFSNTVYVSDHKLDTKFSKVGLWKIRYFKNIQIMCNEHFDLDYDIICLSAGSYFSIVFYECLFNKNNRIKLFWIEDGLGSYINRINSFLPYRTKLFDLICLRKYNVKKIDKLFLYEPKLYNVSEVLDVESIPKIHGENMNNILKYLNHIFDYQITDIKPARNYKYIFLEQSYEEDGNKIPQYELIEYLSNKLGDEILFKLHPRSKREKYNKLNINFYDKDYLPLELFFLNLGTNNKKLITINSTAVFNMKNILDCNNDIILLYELVKLNSNDKLEKFIEKYKKINSEQNVYIPADKEELELVVK